MFCEGDNHIAIHTNGSGEVTGWSLVSKTTTCNEMFEEQPSVAAIFSVHPDSGNSFHFGLLYRNGWINQEKKKKLPTAREVDLATEIYQKCMTVGKLQAVAQLIHDYVTEVKEGELNKSM